MENPEQEHLTNQNESVISITGLYKSFGELHVLKGIDLNVFEGENVAVLGKSGSGKSVLIKIIAGLLKPDQGEVIVLGKQVDKLQGRELDELRLRIGFSFQSSALYDSMNVYQNLAFPLTMNFKHLGSKEIKDAVMEALDAVGFVRAELPPVAREARQATVGDTPEGALVAGDAAGEYFPRDGRVVLADLRGNLLEGQAVPQPVFDLQTLEVCEVLVRGHDGSFRLRPA